MNNKDCETRQFLERDIKKLNQELELSIGTDDTLVSPYFLEMCDLLNCKTTLDLACLEQKDLESIVGKDLFWTVAQNICGLMSASKKELECDFTLRLSVCIQLISLFDVEDVLFLEYIDNIIKVFTPEEYRIIMKPRQLCCSPTFWYVDNIQKRLLANDTVRSLCEKRIISEVHQRERITYYEMIMCLPAIFFEERVSVDSIGKGLAVRKLIRQDEELWYLPNYYSTFLSCVDDLDIDLMHKNILLEYLKGKSLTSVGEKFYLSKERIRQIINIVRYKVKNNTIVFAEDVYVNLFLEYNISAAESKLIFGTDFVYRYIHFMYRKELLRIDKSTQKPLHRASKLLQGLSKTDYTDKVLKFVELLEGLTIPERKCLEAKKEGEYLNVLQMVRFFFIEEHKGEIHNYSSILEQYFKRIENLSAGFLALLPEANKLRLKSCSERYLSGHSEAFANTIKTGKSSLRYYNFSQYNYTKLFKNLKLQNYENTEISTRKLFMTNLELMRQYEVKDEYELHNLLRVILYKPEKYQGVSTELDIHFLRMPIIRIGAGDRFKQFENIVSDSGCTDASNIAELFEHEYGFCKRSSLSWILKEFKTKDGEL